MNVDPIDDGLKRREEEKRERMWDPAERSRVLQETIAWAEQQLPQRRNTREGCLRRQRILLERLKSDS